MHAQKRRLKKFHDAHIINKDFQKGDLVLVYMLKQHTSKLKKRGMGPFVIHELSASGVVQLATLDGEPMANWISGCRVKKYHEPLTPKILQRLHNAKERKQKEAQMKKDAFAEGKETARKRRIRQIMEVTRESSICQLTDALQEDSDCLRPYIRVEIG